MKYAEKISFNPDLSYVHKAKVILGEHAKSSETAKPILTRYYVPQKQVNLIKQALPKKLQNTTFFVCKTDISLDNFEHDLRPHVHTDELCVLNVYLNTSGEETSFFEGEVVPDDAAAVDNGNLYYMVNTDKLIKVENFYANTGDAWLMCTRQPHQVSSSSLQTSTRELLQIYFMDKTYSEVLETFKEGV
jgi:hypothetical protein